MSQNPKGKSSRRTRDVSSPPGSFEFLGGLLIILSAVALFSRPCTAQATSEVETPTASGVVADVQTPIFRIPRTDDPPDIDGSMKEGEWRDASALSGFWYDFSYQKFHFLAPNETQLEVYGAFDSEHLYIAYDSPVYPQGSWLKARGRFPDVTHHPRYGLIWDDHIELELRPIADNRKGFELGFFKWFVNPAGTVADLYWSKGQVEGEWNSKVKARCNVTEKRWMLEMKIPLDRLKHGNYAGDDKEGEPYVSVPPSPETAYRVWFTRGIGGNQEFFNVFDNHVWNTTKTRMILDPDAVSFQVNELGPIMEDTINVNLSVKNHSDRSKTLRLGFFVESAAGTIYSSYNSPQIQNGLLELVPGEVREITLKKPFPGITSTANALWFDVRTAGDPAKAVFRTRLIEFHSKDVDLIPDDGEDFRSRRIDVIAEELRPPRRDFDVTYHYSRFRNRLSAVIDTGIRGASDEARTAEEVKLIVLNESSGEKSVVSRKQPIHGQFATFLFDLPALDPDHTYTLSVLLFDRNKKIVGERKTGSFSPGRHANHVLEYDWLTDPPDRVHLDPVEKWVQNDHGTGDVVWEPFKKLRRTEDGFETLKHRFAISDSGLPEQIYIKPDDRELPLELREDGVEIASKRLRKLGRGPQLRSPMKLLVHAGGTKYTAEVREPAKLAKQGKSEFVYRSKLRVGPVAVTLKTRYDVDGSMHCTLTYGSDEEARIERMELVTKVAGPVDLVTSGIGGKGGTLVAGSDRWKATLPHDTGVVWDSANVEPPGLFYSQFVPFFFFGSGDRGFSWYATSDRNWELNRKGSVMTLSRNSEGRVTWRVKFVNHPTTLKKNRTLKFHVLTHPSKPKPEHYRKLSWLYRGDDWYHGFAREPIELSEAYLKEDRSFALDKSGVAEVSPEKAAQLRDEDPPWRRYGRAGNAHVSPGYGRFFEQRLLHYLEKQIRIGRRHGWYWGYMKPTNGATQNLAGGEAYLRNPENVGADEIPWQQGWTIDHMRRTLKRLARVFKNNNVPQRNIQMANHSATLYESSSWANHLFGEAGARHRSQNIDLITQYPASLWRYQAHHFTGLVSRVVPGSPDGHGAEIRPGDDKRFDRQWLGRALLNDIGVSYNGIHTKIKHVEQGTRLLNELETFGYFKPTETEFLPYWRNQDIVRLGKGRRPDAHLKPERKQRPDDHLYVTVYRRPFEQEGKSGYHVLFVLMNEYHEPVRSTLHLEKPARLFGGHNDLRAGEEIAKMTVPEELRTERTAWAGRFKDTPALNDLEKNRFVTGRIKADREEYGPIWIPRHNYRILYGYAVQN